MSSDEWVIIFRSPSESDCRERALVLQAVGVAYVVDRGADDFVMAVAAADAPRARAELDAYAVEDRDWRIVPLATRRLGDGWNGVLGFVAVVSLMAVFQRRDAFGVDWFSIGKTHAGLIRAGEWWRTVTALTLHADLEHVLSNLVIGGIVGLFAGQVMGSGLAWCSILVGGALGNLLNALVRPAEHTSIGSSTAVFAALGLLAAHGWWQRRSGRASTLQRWAPLIGGAILLSFLGTGGGRTDIPAHLFGFLCGLPLGVVCAKLADLAVSNSRTQLAFTLAALAILALAWAQPLGHRL